MIASLSKQNKADLSLLQFCSTALKQKPEDYDRLIRLLDEEFTKFGSLMPGPHFLNYVHINDARTIFNYCLEHNASTAKAETLFRLSRIEEGGVSGPRPPNTYIWLTSAAEQGSASAQFVLATKILELSRARAQDSAPPGLRPYITVEAYHRNTRAAAESGNRQAQMMLASFYLDRFPLDPKNVEHVNVAEGVRWLRILAEQTDDQHERNKALALSRLGWLYLYGTVTKHPNEGSSLLKPDEYTPNNTIEIAVDYAEALRWFLQIPDVQMVKYCLSGTARSLVEIYRQGLGVSVDLEKANHYQRISNSCAVS